MTVTNTLTDDSAPLICVDSDPLYSVQQLQKVKSLFDRLDAGVVGGYGHGADDNDGDEIALRKTPMVFFQFQLKNNDFINAKVVQVKYADKDLDKNVEDDLLEALKTAVLRIANLAPKYVPYLEEKIRGASISLLRYEIKPGRNYPDLPWHYDPAKIQTITPIHIPKNISGAQLQLQQRPVAKESSVLTITPKENHMVFFENFKAWHRVTPFSIPIEASTEAFEFRDVFTIEIYDVPGKPDDEGGVLEP